MKAFPILIDSQPSYLQSTGAGASLLLTPLGPGTVLRHVSECLAAAGYPGVTIATAFEPDPDYERQIGEVGVRVDAIVHTRDLPARIADYEPSDWLMLVDPTCFPSMGLQPSALMLDDDRGPRGRPRVRHLVALEAHPEGTTELVQLDSAGSVKRIQRYYDDATWLFTSGVACSLLPVSCTIGVEALPFGSLRDLRRTLADRGVPSSDVAIDGGAFDLSEEHDLLGLSERVVLDHFAGRRPTDDGWLQVGKGCQIHPSARFIGPVVLHDRVVIGPDATIVGPAVIGVGARIEQDAVVAHCVVGPGLVVPAGVILRQRAVFGGAGEQAALIDAQKPYHPDSSPALEPSEARDQPRGPASLPVMKAVFDVTAAALGLLVLSPLLLLTAVLIKLESKGPVFFRDRREGKGGRVFECLKFRTMLVGAEAQQRALMAKNQVDGPQFKLDHDPRVTRIGHFLRKASLDELPQLVNVVLLEMSLVGPRPSPFRENQLCVPWRDARLSVRPGITGLWQVCRHDRKQGDFHQWIHFDLLYVRHMSFVADLKILVATVLTLGGQWAVPLSWIITSGDL